VSAAAPGLDPPAPCAAAQVTWGENYGDAGHHGGVAHQFRLAAAAICSDRRIALLGAMQSLFEASMYTFVFLWTPALSPQGGGGRAPAFAPQAARSCYHPGSC
jgi:hypothetical protein